MFDNEFWEGFEEDDENEKAIEEAYRKEREFFASLSKKAAA